MCELKQQCQFESTPTQLLQQKTLTIGESITLRLTSCLFWLDSDALLMLN